MTLAGRKYQTHRNFINRFVKLHQWETRVLDLADEADRQAVVQVMTLWQHNKTKEGMDVGVDLHAIEQLRTLLDQVPLLAVGIYVNDMLCGYTIYATNLFEHADTHYTGIFRVLKQQTALQLQRQGYRYWNHQQDSGFLGLRKSKDSFRPAFYLRKMTIRMK